MVYCQEIFVLKVKFGCLICIIENLIQQGNESKWLDQQIILFL